MALATIRYGLRRLKRVIMRKQMAFRAVPGAATVKTAVLNQALMNCACGSFNSDASSFGLDCMNSDGQNEEMKREQVIATLQAHEQALRAAGVVRLSLFGSTARGDRRLDSDIDLMAAFDEGRDLSLLDVVHIENQLAELLGQPVDLIEEGTLKPRVHRSVEAEALRAF